MTEGCWFCASPKRVVEPDGTPLCDRCRAQLADFKAWLDKTFGRVTEVTDP